MTEGTSAEDLRPRGKNIQVSRNGKERSQDQAKLSELQKHKKPYVAKSRAAMEVWRGVTSEKAGSRSHKVP